MLLIQSHKEEERRKEMMLQSFEEEGQALEVVKAQREKEMRVVKERQALKRQMKAENVERVSRMKEYERMKTLKKIEDTQRRTDAMMSMKMKLIEDRRTTAASTKLQKEAISKVMESVRSDASKAQKIISKALTGKISLASLTGGDSKKTTKRSKSASALPSPEKDYDKSPSKLPPKPDVSGMGIEDKIGGTGEAAAKPYISPYDANFADSQ